MVIVVVIRMNILEGAGICSYGGIGSHGDVGDDNKDSRSRKDTRIQLPLLSFRGNLLHEWGRIYNVHWSPTSASLEQQTSLASLLSVMCFLRYDLRVLLLNGHPHHS